MILRRRDRDSLTLWGVFPVFYMSLTHAAFAYFHTSSLLRFGSFIVHVKQFTRKCHLTFFMAKRLQQIIAADLENFRNRMISRVHDYSIRLKHCEECMKLSTTTKALHCHIFSQLEVNYLLTSLARSTHFHNKDYVPRYQAATLWFQHCPSFHIWIMAVQSSKHLPETSTKL